MQNGSADWLVRELQKRGWTVREFGRRIGVASRHADLIVKGKGQPGPELCRRISEALGMGYGKVAAQFNLPRLWQLRVRQLEERIREQEEMIRELKEMTCELVGETRGITPGEVTVPRPLVMTEGKTDWKHLKAALTRLQALGRFGDLDIEFDEFEDDEIGGSARLIRFCTEVSRAPRTQKIICVFDRDEPRVLEQVSGQDEVYRDWGNKIFSFAIPVPSHRQDCPEISIELYYTDEEIKRADKKGRRLFLSNEFDCRSGRHITGDLNCTDLNKIRHADRIAIIDDRVFSGNNENAALPKNDFAEYVLGQADGFDDFDFSEFGKIFDTISMIVAVS